MIKPKKLEIGDTIGLVSPSSGLANLFPHRLDNGIKSLNDLGFKTKEFSCTRKRDLWSAGTAEQRAKDIEDAFLDQEVNAIITTIGGTTLNEVIPFIDFNIIKNNPKIFCGYSDISIMHFSIFTQTNLTSFYGPCVMTQFGEYPKPLDYTINYFFKALNSTKPINNVHPSDKWTDETELDWSLKKDLTRPRKLKNNKGYVWLKEGETKAPILGGCLPSILQLKGTKYIPDFKNKILFFEIPEGQEFNKGVPLEYVDSYLMDLKLAGIFDVIKGLIVGRPFKYTKEEEEIFKKLILKHTKDYSFPILYNVDIGHTDPMITLPLGVEVYMNSKTNTFRIMESGVI